MALPEAKSVPNRDLNRQIILIFGPPKIGKTTFTSRAENIMFGATPGGGVDRVECLQRPIISWRDALTFLEELKADARKPRPALDLIEDYYMYCSEQMMGERGVEYEGDLPQGKGWSIVRNEFRRYIMKMIALDRGLIMVSHAIAKEQDTRTGKITKMIPNLPGQAAGMITGLASSILYCDTREVRDEKTGELLEERILRTDPSRTYEAGDGTGLLPPVLPLAYKHFAACFNKSKEASKK